ncbi:hypothetical protein BB559_005921 [Furculomyces boomerangus]|uniref:PIH1 N-terminal domain-containing protein n=1 Tax=Furculomyces boomerangus TaxID=61424 RepID=A0A2T9Y5T6_9FUNG|nr:hypothetical protein BB559_005921 [Furculomyces boomerangus]
MCFSHSIPKPKDVGETEIQKAFNANHDANWQIPMYTSEPMYLQDEENVFVFDTIVNSSLQQRAHVDVDMKLYLIELSIEWAEDKFGIVLSRDIMQNPVPYYKTKAKHYLNENVAGLQNVQEESIQAGKRYKKTNEQKVIKNISKRSFRIRNVILNITNILLILDIDNKDINNVDLYIDKSSNCIMIFGKEPYKENCLDIIYCLNSKNTEDSLLNETRNKLDLHEYKVSGYIVESENLLIVEIKF